MDCYLGIDLGSTTTKAVYLDEHERPLGRGITNSRCNYALACEIAGDEAGINSRFMLLRRRIEEEDGARDGLAELMKWLACSFTFAQYVDQLAALEEICLEEVERWNDAFERDLYAKTLASLFERMRSEAEEMFRPGLAARSDFFRDIVANQYLDHAERLAKDGAVSFDRLTAIYDRAILRVEGKNFATAYAKHLDLACERAVWRGGFEPLGETLRRAVDYAIGVAFNVRNTIGTGYGRQTLPIPKPQIRSEILCHGLGAHFMFPNTRTVLDIGGQDTKAIQVDAKGIAVNFQMNDRCAAGCGRYLGYIADEMNMGVHELGPLAMKARKAVRINSTCTVFAGAELRERLALGEKREEILAGLHRAIILRAMSLLARSGGVHDEFTFTGGVAKNAAAVTALKRLISENYGDRMINISPDSIYTGAVGAALFARRDREAI
ncbi:MAG: benzoyl-CoA reductase subunit A [Planctomycetes bacterium]|nr:benzoyl-CoA reductase subunit A [Planctomycetota bacterium]